MGGVVVSFLLVKLKEIPKQLKNGGRAKWWCFGKAEIVEAEACIFPWDIGQFISLWVISAAKLADVSLPFTLNTAKQTLPALKIFQFKTHDSNISVFMIYQHWSRNTSVLLVLLLKCYGVTVTMLNFDCATLNAGGGGGGRRQCKSSWPLRYNAVQLEQFP